MLKQDKLHPTPTMLIKPQEFHILQSESEPKKTVSPRVIASLVGEYLNNPRGQRVLRLRNFVLFSTNFKKV